MSDKTNPVRLGGLGDSGNEEINEKWRDMKDGTYARVLFSIAGLAPYDSPTIDAFARLRVSMPETLFDSKNIFNDPDLATSVDNQPLYFDNQETSGSGTSTLYLPNESSQRLSVSALTAGTRVRQSRMRFNYQPGKSQLVLLTYNLQGGIAGVTKRYGLFDANNGFYLELDGTSVYLVKRSSVSGVAVNTRVVQADWNLDLMDGDGPSGVTIDFSKTQIMLIDYSWLGVGRIRVGFLVAGLIYYVHQFVYTNIDTTVYMQTPNLPVRAEISNGGSGGAGSLDCICASVISEGGSHDLGVDRYASTAGTHLDADSENTLYALLGLRLKSAYLGATVKVLNAALQIHTASHRLEWILVLNPTVADSFTYADESQSALQVARGATANTVTGGHMVAGGFVESEGVASGSAGSAENGIDTVLRLGSLIDGTPDTLVLCVRPIGGSTNVDVEGSLTWRELS